MKKIEAIIQPFRLQEVKEALRNIGVNTMIISDVHGNGGLLGHKMAYRGHEYNIDLIPQVRFDLVVANERLDEVLGAITEAALTGETGDGEIYVYDIADVTSIRGGRRCAA